MSSYEEWKKSCTSAKSQVTKVCNRICQLIVEADNYDTVPELVTKLKQNVVVFTLAHDQVVSLDTDEDVDHGKYFDDVPSNYVEALCKAKSVMHAMSGVTSEGDNDVNKLLCLPKVELKVFSGDPLQYHAFMKSFSVNVK